MLVGEFVTKLTHKNRLAVPFKFRAKLSKKLILMNGYEDCIVLLDLKRFKRLMREVLKESRFINSQLRDVSRFLFGSAYEIELDKQGRFVVPPDLLKYASLKEEVCFIGLVRWIEVWDKQIWEQRKKYIKDNINDISNHLEISLNKIK